MIQPLRHLPSLNYIISQNREYFNIFEQNHCLKHFCFAKKGRSIYNNEKAFVLLDPNEAFEQAKAQKDPTAIYFEALDEVPEELTIENVRIAYYENVMSEAPSRQPVYIFEGGRGESQFAISVSAIKQ